MIERNLIQPNNARCWHQRAGKNPCKCGFTGAARANYRDTFAGVHFKRQTFQYRLDIWRGGIDEFVDDNTPLWFGQSRCLVRLRVGRLHKGLEATPCEARLGHIPPAADRLINRGQRARRHNRGRKNDAGRQAFNYYEIRAEAQNPDLQQ
ncbi:MAG: hypothetical protein N2B03_01735 [Boseongicola sp.]